MSKMNILPEDLCESLVAEEANLIPDAVGMPPTIGAPITLLAEVADADVFKLHSNPKATKTIFLDFDGHSIANSPWENGGPLKVGPKYSKMNATTRQEIQRIWRRVAEDFAPFNVNVTTEDPGSENLRKFGTGDERWGIRCCFTANKNLLTGKPIKNAGGGGTAYYNSFNWSTDDICLVFNSGEYTGSNTASHEVGHTLGLTHDGTPSGGEYYAGHGTGSTSWGTIMGAPWLGNDELLTQWSKGEYFAANCQQDDLATITGSNGFGFIADDHGNSFETATPLLGTSFSCTGLIGASLDVDFFKFVTEVEGVSTFKFENIVRGYINNGGVYTPKYFTSRGPNLDISVTLYREDKSIVQTFNPSDKITADFSISLPAGTYYLSVDGVGFGNPLASPVSGYTDYGSLGQYMITGTLQGAPLPPVEPPPSTIQVIDPNGTVQLLRDTKTDLVSVRVNGSTLPVRLNKAQIKAGQFPDKQILAAEVNAGKNEILWKEVSTGMIRTWSLDSGWNYVTNSPLVEPTSAEGLALRSRFQV